MSRRTAAGLLFPAALAVWTWKLLESHPVPEAVKAGLSGWATWLPYLLAKGLHVTGYAFLAFVGLTWAGGRRGWLVVGFLALHAVGTEVGQTFVPNRTGTPTDVLIDWCGVAAGVLAWRRFS